jgi:putative membrane protein
MRILANTLVTIVAIMHFGFMFLEMFLWTKPTGMRVFRNTLEKARDTAVLAANQGLYNGFLAAGLVFGLLHPQDSVGYQLKIFFLLCVVVAGIYGAYSVSRRIFYIQALPAILALIALY